MSTHRSVARWVPAALFAGLFALVVAYVGAASPPAAVAGASATVTFRMSGYANNVRDRPRYQLGVTRFSGRGSVGGSMTGGTTTRNFPTYYPDNSMSTEIIGYSYTAAPHGGRKRLVLSVRVTASSSEINCQVGTQGTVTLVDDRSLMRNGQNKDRITTIFPVDRCPTFVQGVTNKDNPQTAPRHGGPPDGGQWAKVSISS